MRSRIILLLIIICLVCPKSKLMAISKIVTIDINYTYEFSDNISVHDAKIEGLKKAKIKALSKEFGVVIAQQNAKIIVDKNSQFNSIRNEEVKGEWIETLEEKYGEVKSLGNGILAIDIYVKGKARALARAKTEFTAKVLCRVPELNYENDTFNNEDQLFLYFKTPQKGYIAIYLMDNTKTLYRLLPYGNDSQYKVDSGIDYIFFNSNKKYSDNDNEIQEYYMFTNNKKETNTLFIIYSSNSFVRRNDNSCIKDKFDRILPTSINFDTFYEWLTKNRLYDSDMMVDTKIITILGNKLN